MLLWFMWANSSSSNLGNTKIHYVEISLFLLQGLEPIDLWLFDDLFIKKEITEIERAIRSVFKELALLWQNLLYFTKPLLVEERW